MIRLLQTKKDIISNCFTAVLCLFITLLPIKASCQKQANVWYFGDHAGLDFKTGSPVALSNGALKTDEGCASISDTAGNILFYTDGITVYNKKDTSMPNGTGLNGHSSSTQSSIIIPVPGNDSIFYIFTTDAQGGANGCEYSRVNMHKNGGHGDVISKNKMLFTPSAEKITAIRNNNGSDIWVIGHKHNTDTFYTYKIDNKGINSSVVKSKSGSSYSTKSGVIGYMKASPDGKKLALAISSTNTVEVFDFDDKSGVVSNCRSMTDNTNFSGVYGLEFSPDCSKLYISTYNSPRKICQVNVNAGSSTNILKSLMVIYQTSNDKLWALQLAVDGKIYVDRQIDTLGCIKFPNNAGFSCKYISGAVPLGTGTANLGLPSFIQSYFGNPVIVAKNFCLGDTTRFNLSASVSADSTVWNFGDSLSKKNYSNSLSPFHIYSHTGNYKTSCLIYRSGVADTISKAISIGGVLPFTLGKDTILCKGLSYTLKVSQKNCTFLWQDKSKDSILKVSKIGKYWLNVSDSNSCTYSDTVVVSTLPFLKLNLGKDTAMCTMSPVKLNAATKATAYLWQDGSTDSTYDVSTPGKYWVEARNGCYTVSDTISILELNPPALNFGSDTLLCPGQKFVLHATCDKCTYKWQNGSKDSIYPVNKAGKIKAIVANSIGCISSDSINVTARQNVKINLGNDTTLCNGSRLNLNAAFPGATYFWQDSITSPSRIITAPGKYMVTVQNECNTVQDSITVAFVDPPVKTLEPSQTLCSGSTLILDATCPDCKYLWEDNYTTPTLKINKAGKYSVTKSNQCGTLKESIQVFNRALPYVNLGSDTELCVGESLTLNAPGYGYTYQWQDSSTESSYHVNKAGKYKVTLGNECGTASDSIDIEFRDCYCHLYVPTAFTPNHDGLNDEFLPSGCEAKNYSMKIFNRWGENIFQSDDITRGWDGTFLGTRVPEGLYFYIISLDNTNKSPGSENGSFLVIW